MLVVLVTHIETFSYLKLEQSSAVAGSAARAWWMFWASNNGQNLPSFAPLCSQWGAPEHKPAINWSSWDTDMKIYRTLFSSQNFFVHEVLCDLTDFTCNFAVIWNERQHFPPWQEQTGVQGKNRQGKRQLCWIENKQKKKALGRSEDWNKMVCEGFVLTDTESEWWSPNTHFRRKLVRISVTSEREETQHQCRIDTWTLLCCSPGQTQKLWRYIYFFFFICGSPQCCMMKRCKLRSQKQQMDFEFFWFLTGQTFS